MCPRRLLALLSAAVSSALTYLEDRCRILRPVGAVCAGAHGLDSGTGHSRACGLGVQWAAGPRAVLGHFVPGSMAPASRALPCVREEVRSRRGTRLLSCGKNRGVSSTACQGLRHVVGKNDPSCLLCPSPPQASNGSYEVQTRRPAKDPHADQCPITVSEQSRWSLCSSESPVHLGGHTSRWSSGVTCGMGLPASTVPKPPGLSSSPALSQPS